MTHSFTRSFLVVAAGAIALAATPVSAQICGDPDATGDVTVTDGVNVLRQAAQLSSPCSSNTQLCDVDAAGGITVTDGVNVLRAAAFLPAALTCGAAAGDFVTSVTTSDGTLASFNIGVAPVPAPSPATTIQTINGSSTATAGGSNVVAVSFDATAAAAALAGTGNSTFVFSIADAQGDLFAGFWEFPLDQLSGTEVLTVRFPQDLGIQPFLLCPATRVNGALSNYGALRQDPASP